MNQSTNNYDNFDFSLLDLNFYKFDRNKFLRNTPLKERLSSGQLKYKYITTTEELIKVATKYLFKFSSVMFKYVTNESNQNVIFTLKTTSSNCSLKENKIVIDMNLLHNENIPFQLRVDAIQGIIFHEFLHKRITIFDIAEFLEIPIKDYYAKSNKSILDEFYKSFPKKNIDRHIWNIIEDYRIEKKGVELFPGYGFYLDETRKYAFYHLKNRELTDKLSFSKFAIDYLMIKILMPELINLTVEKGEFFFKEAYTNFIKDIDSCILDNEEYIYGNTFEQIKLGVELLSKVFKQHGITEKDAKEIPSFNKLNPFTASSSPQEQKANSIPDSNIDEWENIIVDIVNDINENNEEINSNSAPIIGKVEKSEFAPSISKINIYKVDKGLIDKIMFRKAQQFSSTICANLGFLSSRQNRINNSYCLEEGELDESELYSISYNKNIFFEEQKYNGFELDIGILLDESYSMYNLMQEAKTACLTLLLSFKPHKHINLFAYGHTSNYSHNNSKIKDEVALFKYYNSLENFIDVSTIYNAYAKEGNADGYAIELVCDLMKKSKTKNKNKILLVISDGQPTGYSNVAHTKEVVKKYELQGFTIIQICMANIENSSEMFTHYVAYNKDRTFIQELKKVLNKILIKFHNLNQ